MATIAAFRVPQVVNEPLKNYGKDSGERRQLAEALERLKKRTPLEIPLEIGKELKTASVLSQVNPASHADVIAKSSCASRKEVEDAIDAAMAAKKSWETLPFADRAAVFLKAADLISGKYRYEIMAATMLGQGKNAWQAEIDAAAELIDFLRFNVQYAEEIYAHQPAHNSVGVWNRAEYRPLEGFVYAVSPFNFTAIGGNLPCAPALMGNVVIWKPSPSATASNWLVHTILKEAGLPSGVIQFVPGDAEEITNVVLAHRQFASLHYTGSTAVFRSLYSKIAAGIAEARYLCGYPRIVGETGGKNFHLMHRSADITNAVVNTIRAAFEYQGQKCSACSRAYVPASIWLEFKELLVKHTDALKMGDPVSFDNFIGPVIHKASFKKLADAIDAAKNDSELELLTGGTYDDKTGYFVRPTIYQTKNPEHPLMSRELFGPILLVYVYDDGKNPDEAFKAVCDLVDRGSDYGLTGAVFVRDRAASRLAEDLLRNAAGNFYVNCKCTGAVVGQQPFGGARASGTNEKAGSKDLLGRFVSVRSIKEQFMSDQAVEYPSNEI